MIFSDINMIFSDMNMIFSDIVLDATRTALKETDDVKQRTEPLTYNFGVGSFGSCFLTGSASFWKDQALNSGKINDITSLTADLESGFAYFHPKSRTRKCSGPHCIKTSKLKRGLLGFVNGV